ncbi:MAG: tRNA preQ1(34) S-adenosylmethionine ribosyltransferase-isomerase QueA [Coriobacteriales bacterium]|jgi:S-adenosylmethionine:tRNA ribosyltransferase-isomerase
MLTEDFDYDLPEDRIAQWPWEPRDECKLMVLGRKDGSIEHRIFKDIIDYFEPGDLLVANESRVLPCRLIGRKAGSGGRAELLLLKQKRPDFGDGSAEWEGLVKPGKRLKPGAKIEFFSSEEQVAGDDGEKHPVPGAEPVLTAEIVDWSEDGSPGERLVKIQSHVGTLDEAIHRVGKAPLPPYIHGYDGDPELYQTVYSKRESSAAAPTAGLHFTTELLDRIRDKGVGFATVELEIGLGTFRAVTTERAEDHDMHSEVYYVSQETIDRIEETKRNGGRVIAVGTTSMRSLESAWDSELGKITPRDGESTKLFILPGFEFHVVDALITNFHVPKSTLMMLVSAFSTRENILHAYKVAIEENYRMLSFGDAMLII